MTTLFDIPLVQGQDTYKDSGNAKIFDFFEKVPELQQKKQKMGQFQPILGEN